VRPGEVAPVKAALLELPDKAAELLRREADIIRLGAKYYRANNALYLARGGTWPRRWKAP